MERLVVTLKTITPLFLGGAEPDKWAELRAPSIKGAMRFWYRAIDADCNERVELEKHDSPERVAFGLPLSFRYNNSLNKIPKKDKSGKPIIDRNTGKPKMEAPNTTFEGEEHDRSASPIHIRIVQIEENFYPFYIRLDAPLLENSEQIKDSYGTGYSKPTGKILDTFWNELKKNNGKEKTWK